MIILSKNIQLYNPIHCFFGFDLWVITNSPMNIHIQVLGYIDIFINSEYIPRSRIAS